MPDPMPNSMLSEVFWGLSGCGEPPQNSGVHSGMHIGQRTSGAVGFDSPNSTLKFDCPETSWRRGPGMLRMSNHRVITMITPDPNNQGVITMIISNPNDQRVILC